MPILSATKFAAAADSLFEPSTMANRPAPPPHSFHFAKPQAGAADFDKHFFLDSGWNHKQRVDPLLVRTADGKKIDVSDHKARYIRLFRLTLRRRYYLSPWVTVPFRVVGGMASPTARTGPTPSDPTEIRLTVRPYSIYEGAISTRTKRRITRDFQTSASPPQLKLAPEKPAIVDARWTKTNGQQIDEMACIYPQEVTIRIYDSGNGYPNQTYVDIQDSNSLPVGRVYILFLEEWSHKVVFFDVTKTATSNPTVSQLTIKMVQDSSPDAQKYLGYLNKTFSKTGLVFSAVSPSLTEGVSITILSDIATPVTVDTVPPNADFTDAEKRPDFILDSIYSKFMKKLAPSAREEHVFVFLAPWAASGGHAVTTGTSRGGQKTSCIFVPQEGTLCHEVGHALGLVHSFFAFNEDEVPKVRANIIAKSVDSLSALGVGNAADFYNLNDDMNLSNSCSIFDARPDGTIGGIFVNPTTVQWHYHYFVVDRRPIFSTHNLMDYQKADQMAKYKRDELVKHQIELMRYMVFNKFELLNMA